MSVAQSSACGFLSLPTEHPQAEACATQSLSLRSLNLLLGRGDYILNREAKMFLQRLDRRRSAETVHTNAGAGPPDIALPPERRSHFHGYAGRDPRRQNRIAICLVFAFE